MITEAVFPMRTIIISLRTETSILIVCLQQERKISNPAAHKAIYETLGAQNMINGVPCALIAIGCLCSIRTPCLLGKIYQLVCKQQLNRLVGTRIIEVAGY